MNEVLGILHGRKSVRAFTGKGISPENKNAILQAACSAPSAGNQQLYTILDITDPGLLQQLAVSCDNQPFIAQAPMALVFCADQRKWLDAFLAGGCQPRKPGPGDFALALADAFIAAQTAVIAAQSLGIGSCYIGDVMEHCTLVRTMLALPNLVFPAAMVVFGYPTPQQARRVKPARCSLEHIVHENRYRRMDATELGTMLRRGADDWQFEPWIQAFCKRKYNAEFSEEMSRSVAQYLEDYGMQAGEG